MIKDAIETDSTFSSMFTELLKSEFSRKNTSRDKAGIAIQSSYRSQFRNVHPLSEETLYFRYLFIIYFRWKK